MQNSCACVVSLSGSSFFFFFFLAMPAEACGSFQARGQIHAIEVTRATAVQCQILNLLSHQETPGSSIFA